MDINRQTSSDTTTGSSEQVGRSGSLSPEVVRLVTEKVYALFLEDLRIERERRHLELIGSSVALGGGFHGHID